MIGRMADLDQVTALCGKSCVFHPDNALSFYSDTSDFSPLNEENPYSEPLQLLSEAFSGSKQRVELLSAEEVSKLKVNPKDLNAYVDYVSTTFRKLQSERADAQQKILQYTSQIENTSHFVGLDLNLDDIRECDYIKARFGALPKESYDKLDSYNQNPYVIFFPCTNDEHSYWGVYFAPIDMVSEVDRIFSSLYFERTRLAELTGSPETVVESLRENLRIETERVNKIDHEFDAFWKKEKATCQKVYSWLSEQSVYFGIRHYAARYNDNFILTGWIPADQETK